MDAEDVIREGREEREVKREQTVEGWASVLENSEAPNCSAAS